MEIAALIGAETEMERPGVRGGLRGAPGVRLMLIDINQIRSD